MDISNKESKKSTIVPYHRRHHVGICYVPHERWIDPPLTPEQKQELQDKLVKALSYGDSKRARIMIEYGADVLKIGKSRTPFCCEREILPVDILRDPIEKGYINSSSTEEQLHYYSSVVSLVENSPSYNEEEHSKYTSDIKVKIQELQKEYVKEFTANFVKKERYYER